MKTRPRPVRAASPGAPRANRRYKASVFARLFGESRERMLGLYDAFGEGSLGPDAEVEVTTLQDAVFMDRVNDLSFTAEGRVVVFVEHQATINRNMPLRFLIYGGRVYEKVVDADAIYKGRRVRIPKPEFIVLYNGTEPAPEQDEMRLSEAFLGMEGGVEPGLDPGLELKVRVYNINKGYNLTL
jgi:hypothetical protein